MISGRSVTKEKVKEKQKLLSVFHQQKTSYTKTERKKGRDIP